MKHEVKLVWDDDTQTVEIKFDPKEFKTWEFMLGIIEMSKLKAQQQMQLAMMLQAQQQMQNNNLMSAIRR